MTPARRAWYEANKEKQREYARAWYQRNKAHPDRLEKEKQKAIRRREKKTGFSNSLFSEVFHEQAWACAICERDLRDEKRCADHDHVTGEPRGVLCSRCNLAIGLFEDQEHLLRAAAEYIGNPPVRNISSRS